MKTLLIAYRLHLTGYRRIEGEDETPGGHSTLKSDEDPYPIMIRGIEKPIPSNKIGKYLTSDFYYYLRIYKNVKNYGLPYQSWLDAPRWMLDLVDKFDSVTEEFAIAKR
jgi:hypothetical protein